jgi:hypothetical protein
MGRACRRPVVQDKGDVAGDGVTFLRSAVDDGESARIVKWFRTGHWPAATRLLPALATPVV